MFYFIAFLFFFNYQIIGILGLKTNDVSINMNNIRYEFLKERDRYIAYGFIKVKTSNGCNSVQNYHLKCIFSDVYIDSEDQFSYSHKVYPIMCPNTDINVMSDNGFSKYFGCLNEYNREIVAVDITSLYQDYKSKNGKMIDNNTTAVAIVGIIALFVVTIVGIVAENLPKIKDIVESYGNTLRASTPLPPAPVNVLSPKSSVGRYNEEMEQNLDEDKYLYGERRAGPNQSVLQHDNEDIMSDSTVDCRCFGRENQEDDDKSSKVLLPSCSRNPV